VESLGDAEKRLEMDGRKAWDAPAIDSEGGLALYRQIKDDLAGRIQRGELKPGDPLPSERELCERYGVSRPTLRQATQDLVRQGVLVVRRGVGTFVAGPIVRQQLGSVLGFTEKMAREGRRASTEVLERSIHRASELDASIATELGLEPDARIMRVVRRRHADDVPVMVERTHISIERFPGIEDLDLEKVSLYQALRERYGVEITQLRETLEPVLLSEDDARLLNARPRSPSIQATITSLDQDARPVEHTTSRVRGDSSQYYIEVGDGRSANRVQLRQPQLDVSL
jgi:GntR family transcriptional regulator, N-acetylglucosamine utilization regulator